MTVTIQIRATRGTTEYHFAVEKDQGGPEEYTFAERAASQFEAWLNDIPNRISLLDQDQHTRTR